MAARMEKTRHAGIYRRGGRYVVVWQHKGRQHKSFHRTLAEAREAKGQRQGGERTPVTRQPFEDYAREWLEGYAGRTSRGFSKASRADYRRALEQHAIPFFRGWKLADVEAPDVRRLVTALEAKGLAPASVVKNLVPLKALFATAVEDGALRSNPTTGVRVNRRVDEAEEEVEVKAMTRAQLSAVLEATDEEWRPLFELLAHTGLRISELLGLDWSDLEFGARPRLRVRRQFYRGDLRQLKTRSGRRDLPLSPGMARRLWAVRPAKAEGPMFATRNGTRYLDRNVRRVLDRTSERAGVEWIGFHTFRHTCASMLFDGGKNVRQVSEWLGHADPAFTMRVYVHLMDDGLGAADFLDQAVVFPRKRSAADPPAAADAAVGAGAAVA